MSRCFGRSSRHEMSDYEKNILSDPTTDGNVHEDNFSADPTASPPPYRYEEFDRRPVMDRENSSETSDFTLTCPTCGGTGKLTRGKMSCGVFLFSQKRNARVSMTFAALDGHCLKYVQDFAPGKNGSFILHVAGSFSKFCNARANNKIWHLERGNFFLSREGNTLV